MASIQAGNLDNRYRFGIVEIHVDERALYVQGRRSPVGARAFDLLLALLDRRDRVVSKDELLNSVWPGLVVEEHNLETHISALRKLLGKQAITTITGRGYQFTMPSLSGGGYDPGASTLAVGLPSMAGFVATGLQSESDGQELPLPDKPSIAVLPFSNMGDGSRHQFFADGVTEDVITELSRFRSLFVISRDSSFVYRGRACDHATTGRELGVRYLLEGSVRCQGDAVRVTGQLIESSTGKHIWGEKFDRTVADVFAVQEDIARAICGAIAPRIEVAELTKVSRRRPGNLTAYEAALRAWSHSIASGSTTDRTVGEEAIRQAKEVLEIDPDSRMALNALAWANGCLLYFQIASNPEQSLREAQWAAVRAVELDRSDALSLALKAMTGLLARRTGEYREILAEARQAHELNPNDTFVLLILAHVEAFGGESEEAIRHALQILRLDPKSSRVALVFNILAMACFGVSRYEEGVRWAMRAIHELPSMPLPYSTLTTCLIGMGEFDRARAAFDALRVVSPIYAESRINGNTAHWHEPNRSRHVTFIRVAAGIEDRKALDTFR